MWSTLVALNIAKIMAPYSITFPVWLQDHFPQIFLNMMLVLIEACVLPAKQPFLHSLLLLSEGSLSSDSLSVPATPSAESTLEELEATTSP